MWPNIRRIVYEMSVQLTTFDNCHWNLLQTKYDLHFDRNPLSYCIKSTIPILLFSATISAIWPWQCHICSDRLIEFEAKHIIHRDLVRWQLTYSDRSIGPSASIEARKARGFVADCGSWKSNGWKQHKCYHRTLRYFDRIKLIV